MRITKIKHRTPEETLRRFFLRRNALLFPVLTNFFLLGKPYYDGEFLSDRYGGLSRVDLAR
ncbi:hypothetical protein, partial [Paenibacillus sp.]|uniref:hypothetical protein n=1 Tax=Paenibacillus sp. TaxID=58172 RepID=UPI002916D387